MMKVFLAVMMLACIICIFIGLVNSLPILAAVGFVGLFQCGIIEIFLNMANDVKSLVKSNEDGLYNVCSLLEKMVAAKRGKS